MGRLEKSYGCHLEGAIHAEASTREERPGSLGHRPRLHGDELRLRPAEGQAGDDRAAPDGRRPRRHLLRHGRGLRPVHERGAGGRGARPGPRPGRDRHQVRLRPQRARQPSREGGLEQPARAHQAGRRGVAQAAACRDDRPLLSAPRRPRRAHRGRRGGGEGADPGGQGQALRPLRGGRADDPPRARGPAGRRAPERILAVVAATRGRGDPDARGARHRLRAVQPARQGLPHRQDRREHDLRQLRLPQHPAALHAGGDPKANQALVDLLGQIAARSRRRPRRSRSPGCSRRSRGSSRSRAPRSCIAWTRTSARPTSS